MMLPRVCIFAKPPIAGQVKTRLAAALGSEAAAELACAFLDDTLAAVRALGWARVTVASTAPREGVETLLQGEGDLGARIERVLRAALADAPFAIAIGADAPALPRRLLEAARDALQRADAVLGPADDGGFYLLGVRRCPEGLLADLPWSRSDTFVRTLARLRERGLRTELIDPWFDVDRVEDLEQLRALIEGGAIDAPRTASVLEKFRRISVIIPVLDEERRIGALLAELRGRGFTEVIVVDGGSRDRTVEIARAACWGGPRVATAPRGRASQMNAGARLATGDVLLFLHADASLPAGAAGYVEGALADPRVIAGAFHTWHVADDGRRAPWLHLADLRSRWSGLPYGDQALFVRREAFEGAGGFPDQPLMEDLELSRRLRRLGRIAIVPASVRVSGRRFLAHPIRDTLLVNVFPLLYRLGVPPASLARLYRDVR
jgi:rSAM/selenodomain-associated transferase 2/rSAM/selenodomain-associated transferase 1